MVARLCRHLVRCLRRAPVEILRHLLHDLAVVGQIMVRVAVDHTAEVPAAVRAEARADRMEVLAGTDRQDIADKKFLSQPKHNRRGDSERVAAPVVFLRAIWKMRIGIP